MCTLWSPQGWSAVGGVLGAAAASKLERRRPPEVCRHSRHQCTSVLSKAGSKEEEQGVIMMFTNSETALLSRNSKPCLLCLSVLSFLHPLSTVRTDRVMFDPGKVNTKPVLLFSR